MSSKTKRQNRIIALIREHEIGTQEELARLLSENGFPVTQATVSRDIKELQLVKIPSGNGSYRYALPDESSYVQRKERIMRLFRECVISYDYSENIVVLNTLPATASGVAEAIDTLEAEEVIGTMAGERTVFVVIKPREAVGQFLERLRNLVG